MIFKCKAKNGVFWNAGKPVKFVNGICETDDKNAIAALEKAGYKAEAEKKGEAKGERS